MRNSFIAVFAALFLVSCDEEHAQVVEYNMLNSPIWSEIPDGTRAESNLSQENWAVILDASGSMDSACRGEISHKMTAAVDALDSFVAMLPADHNLSLIAFRGNGPEVLVDWGSSNGQQVMSAARSISANGGTPLGGSIAIAEKMLSERMFSQLGHGRYRVVIITDGEAGDDLRTPLAHLLANTTVEVNTIGLCIGEGHALNSPEWVRYVPAETAGAMRAALEEFVAAE